MATMPGLCMWLKKMIAIGGMELPKVAYGFHAT